MDGEHEQAAKELDPIEYGFYMIEDDIRRPEEICLELPHVILEAMELVENLDPKDTELLFKKVMRHSYLINAALKWSKSPAIDEDTKRVMMEIFLDGMRIKKQIFESPMTKELFNYAREKGGLIAY